MNLNDFFKYNPNIEEHYKYIETIYAQERWIEYFILGEIFLKRILIVALIENVESSDEWGEIRETFAFEYKNKGEGKTRLEKHEASVNRWEKRMNLKNLIEECLKYKIFPVVPKNREYFLKYFYLDIDRKKYNSEKKRTSLLSISDVIKERNNFLHNWNSINFSKSHWLKMVESIRTYIHYFIDIISNIDLGYWDKVFKGNM